MLRIELLLLGKTKDEYISAGIDDFSKRLRRFAQIQLNYIKVGRLKNKSDSEIKAIESQLLNNHIGATSYRLALDSSGKQLDSEEFSNLLTGLEDSGIRNISFVIGGPLGLAREQLLSADYVLSLSRLTFTHDMVRVLLLEQIYRAFMIRAGTKYHK